MKCGGKEFGKNEAYQKMTEYAVSAESYFYVMDIACAQYVRYAIEQYVQYVSAFYKIPYATQPAHLSHYLYGENAKQHGRIFLLDLEGNVRRRTFI